MNCSKCGMLTEGQKVVRIWTIMGRKLASNATIGSVQGVIARCVDDTDLRYDARTGQEISPAIPGCVSELIPWDE